MSLENAINHNGHKAHNVKTIACLAMWLNKTVNVANAEISFCLRSFVVFVVSLWFELWILE